MKRAIVVALAVAACVPASRHPERQQRETTATLADARPDQYVWPDEPADAGTYPRVYVNSDVQPATAPEPKPEPGPRTRMEGGVRVIVLDHPNHFRCFTFKGTSVRGCLSQLDKCRAWAKLMKSAPTCEPASAAACFLQRSVVTGTPAMFCFDEIEGCRIMRKIMTDEDHPPTTDGCFVMRYEP